MNAVRLSTVTILLYASATAHAQIIHDGSLGPLKGSTGPNFQIEEADGHRAGSNLFHSFSQFDLTVGESANFNGSAGIENVLSRVTGPNASSIDGTIRSNIPGANVFLMNPKGIVFGENARLDVTGAFTATTADQLNLGTNGVFKAVSAPGEKSLLTSAPVASFGFLGPSPAGITVDGSQLEIAENGKALSLVAGPITLHHGANIRTDGGNVNLISVASGGTAALDVTDPVGSVNTSSLATLGDVSVDSATVDASDTVAPFTGGGRIIVRGGRLEMVDSTLRSNSNDGGVGRGIDLMVAGSVSLAGDGGITSDTVGSGNAGTITIAAGYLSLADGGSITSETQGSGNAGTITIHAGSLSVADYGTISSDTVGSGNAGTITIAAGSLSVAGRFSGINSNTFGSGNAGTITIHAGSLSLADYGTINSATLDSGNAGTITIAAGSLSLADGGSITSTSSISSISSDTSGNGNAGTITIDAGYLSLADGGSITSETQGSGNAGTITIHAGSLSVAHNGSITSDTVGSGNAGTITIDAGSLSVADGSDISSDTSGDGNAGTITIDAVYLSVADGGSITSETQGSRNAGTITIHAGSLSVAGDGYISSETQGSGNAGSVLIDAGSLSLTGTSQIATSTGGSGNAGRILIEANQLYTGPKTRIASDTETFFSDGSKLQGTGNAGRLTILVGTARLSGSLSTRTTGPGSAGAVLVQADRLDVPGGRVSSESTGSGPAGDVTVIAGRLNLNHGGLISATTSNRGQGGHISVTAKDLRIDGSTGMSPSGIFAESSGIGNAGSINIKVTGTHTLRMRNGGVISSLSAGQGKAGGVNIWSRGLVALQSGSSINVLSELTNAGSITITSLTDILLSGGSSITARAARNAGDINLTAGRLIFLRDGSSMVAEAGNNGGNIFLNGGPDDTSVTVLLNSLISANAERGNGGNVQIGTDYFLSQNSQVTASSEFGTDGTVRIDAISNLSSAQDDLEGEFEDANDQLRERCAVLLAGDRNSFVHVGRGGLPVMPGRFLPAMQLLKLPPPAPRSSP